MTATVRRLLAQKQELLQRLEHRAEVIGVAMSIDRRGLTVCVIPWRDPDRPLPANETQKRKARRLSGFRCRGAT